MTQETQQGQTPARAEKPAPAGKPEQPKGRADQKKALIELTDVDLQTVNGGAGKGGIGGEF